MLSLTKCSLDLFDQFTNYVFVDQKIIKVLLCGISFCIVVYCVVGSIELKDKYVSKMVF